MKNLAIALSLSLFIASPALAAVTASVTTGVLTVSSDIVVAGAGDTIALTCTSGGNVQINATDPSSGAVAGASLSSIVIFGGSGDDTIDVSKLRCIGSTSVSLNGGAGNDTIIGSKKGDSIDGGDGNDTITGGNGNDTINAGLGDDVASGGNGKDTLNGGDGNDTLNGQNGKDSLFGDAGDDILSGGEGNDKLDGGENDGDNDTLNDKKGKNSCSNGEAGNCGKPKGNGGNGKGKN